MKKKLTRAEAIAVALEAKKIPAGITSKQYQARLPVEAAAYFQKLNPSERGDIIKLGLALSQNGFLPLYQLLDSLGVRVITTIVDQKITIVTRHKTYTGNNHAELLIEVLRDRLDSPNRPIYPLEDDPEFPEG